MSKRVERSEKLGRQCEASLILDFVPRHLRKCRTGRVSRRVTLLGKKSIDNGSVRARLPATRPPGRSVSSTSRSWTGALARFLRAWR